MRDLDRAMLLGVVLGMIFLSLFYIMKPDTKNQPETPKSNFTVVDKYENCDVVQWSYGGLADYKYFLYCPK
jgi:hypothetical protein